jgi:hypothetical protein
MLRRSLSDSAIFRQGRGFAVRYIRGMKRPALRATASAVLAALALAPLPAAAAAAFADLETGVVLASRNDVRIPGDGGTRFSLVDDLRSPAAPYGRTRLGVTLADRHVTFLTWAPVRLDARGTLRRDVRFEGVDYPAGSEVSARFVFDSYRLTYRYGLVRTPRLDVDLGGTAFVRDAEVAVQGARRASKADVGFVPLLSFRVAWRVEPRVSLVLDGDALAAPQGRAEDVLVAVEVALSPGVAVRAGYRLIEGGADNDVVYSFALLNHLGLGLTVRI